MKNIIFLISIIYILANYSTNFESIIVDLKKLEEYIRQYKKEKNPSESITHLITCYIRKGVYDDSSWKVAGGDIPSDLAQYIIDKDSSEGTNAQQCQKYREVELPNNEVFDFVHFFAVMNGIENGGSYTKNYAHLVGWGGDTFQLLQDIKNNEGNLSNLMDIAKTFFRLKGGFGLADFISDLDAPIILNSKTDNNYFADIIQNYYKGKNYLNRINNFVGLTFPSLKSKDKFRDELFNVYNSDSLIKILECKDGIREGSLNCLAPGELKPQYENHQKAAIYVVSDYLSQNYNYSSKLIINFPFLFLFAIFFLIL